MIGLHAGIAIGLHDDPLHASAVGKVVDVSGAEIGRDGVVDLLEGHPERGRLLAVDDQLDLRRGRQSFDINVLKYCVLGGGGQQLVFRAHQLAITTLTAILQAETEAAGIAKVVDRRRLQRRDFAVAQRREAAVNVGDDRFGGVGRAPLRPVLQRDEGLCGILALTEKAKAGQERHGIDAFAFQQIVLHALDDLQRARKRRFRRREHVGGDEALVINGQKAARKPDEGETNRADHHRIDQHQAPGAQDRPADPRRIAAPGLFHAAVEPAERAAAA